MVHRNIEQALAFGTFRFLPLQRALDEAGRPVRLGSRALDILSALLDRVGEPVGKDELMARAWPNAVVEEATLRVHVAALRKALGDGRNGARYIQNVTGRGYCFVAPVRQVEGDAPATYLVSGAATGFRENLPASRTRMIGRGSILGNVAERLPRERLITIVGPGGIGKTALAIAVANTISRSYVDGAYFVDLASVSNARLVPNTLASVLGSAVLSEDALPDLMAFLRDKTMLIVLDNCEHVIGAAASIAAEMLREAPNLHLLATSREPLRVEGERVHRLSPLETPEPSAALSVAEVLAFPAIELFLERAMESQDTFEFKDTDVPMVSDLCRRLDGIPLAIELVAARVDLLGLRGLVNGLDEDVHRLTNSRHAAPSRQKTLHATLDWSYALLSDTEQVMLRRVAVFPGGFDLTAARAIASDSAVSDADVLNGILGMGAKSLLTAEVHDDDVIYRLLHTARAYAREKLRASQESAEISRRHARFFRDVWHSADAASQNNAGWLKRNARRIDDVRAALDWCFSPDGDIQLGLSVTAASGPLWLRFYLVKEYESRLRLALNAHAANCAENAQLEMQLNVMLGYTLLYMGDQEAAAAFDNAIEIAGRLGDKVAFCDALFGIGVQFIQAGEYQTAIRCAERACHHINDLPAETAVANHNAMALAQHLVGNQAIARHHADRALSQIRALTADARPYWINHRVTARATLAPTLWVLGLPDQALKMAHASLEDFLLTGDARSVAYALYHACSVALWAGDLPTSDRFVTMALDHAIRHSLAVGLFRARSFATVLGMRRESVSDKAAQRDAILNDPLCDRPYLDSLATLDEELVGAEAIARAESGRAGWCAAEILRANTAVRLKNGTLSAAGADTQFRRSLDIARRQGALSWELRAATSLARLWRDQGRVAEAYDLLTSVLDRFTEGFGTADLVTAGSLLRALSTSRPARQFVKLGVVEYRPLSPGPAMVDSPRRIR